jgi:hypothetical protein
MAGAILALAACAQDDEPVPAVERAALIHEDEAEIPLEVDELEDEAALSPGDCDTVCTPSSPCNKKCFLDGEMISCGAIGVCQQPCQYVPATQEQLCRIESDTHIWGVRVEGHAETMYVDANGSPHCPPRWQTRVVGSADCWGVYNGWDCCLGHYGLSTCSTYWPGFCH